VELGRPLTLAPYLVGLRHVGAIVPDCVATAERWQSLLGGTLRHVDGGATRFAFLTVPTGETLEFIEPVSDHFRALLLGRGHGADHVCFTVTDLPGAVALLAEQGVRTGHVTPDGFVATPTFRMAYFDPADTGGVLLELVEDLSP
jgi:catechol 2,3-dioxygenase-like lactoylglutathione lyase family enzyme